MTETVAAVVVTYNRKQLLTECLDSLLAQTWPVNKIILIDNASTDGTPELLEERGYLANPLIDYVRLSENTGGAGGFHEGVQRGYEAGYDWLWLMDDDCFPCRDALKALVEAGLSIEGETGNAPAILASHVRWTDDSPHPMNWPIPRVRPENNFFSALDAFGVISIRSSSFVSCLVNAEVAREEALPVAGYFIWNDDVEYTSRILKYREGYLVPASIVVHATKSRYIPVEAQGDRFYYEVRNKLWMIFRSKGLFFVERLRFMKSLIGNISRYLKVNRFSLQSAAIVARGLAGAIRSPALDVGVHHCVIDRR